MRVNNNPINEDTYSRMLWAEVLRLLQEEAKAAEQQRRRNELHVVKP